MARPIQQDASGKRTGVLDADRDGSRHLENAWAVSDGSQFTTGAAENPTLTIVTLAIRQADYLADQMSKGEI